MGRQHTTWISDETWRKLDNIEGESVSEKIRNAIDQADPDREMALNAKLRQLDRARESLRRLKFLIEEKEMRKVDALFEDIWWLVEE
jgi:hypothetical protein